MSASGSAAAPLRRLARVVQELHPELSYTRAKRAVSEGQVLLEGAPCRDPGALVPAGAAVSWDRHRPADRTPAELRIELLHADDDVAVVVKPAGLLSIPTPEREKDTLLSRLALAIHRRRGERPFLAVVQRLDRDTSGLVAFATSRRGQASLSHQLLDRTMSRIYDAIVEGDMGGEAGTIDHALIGDGMRRRRWVTRPGERGKPSVTHWRVVERLAGATRLRVALETGRTHQIRIHLASIGHPVVGEPVYRAGEEEELKISFPRQALHAGELAFRHPADGRAMRFTAPPPEDFERLLTRLRRKGVRS
jgi:23S rRNA pseudouridine1911/1915/1917 synthase